MDVETVTLHLSVTRRTADKLKAYTVAVNGSLHNQADAAMAKGIDSLIAGKADTVQARYAKALAKETSREG